MKQLCLRVEAPAHVPEAINVTSISSFLQCLKHLRLFNQVPPVSTNRHDQARAKTETGVGGIAGQPSSRVL